MTNIFRIRRRNSGSPGAPASLVASELAFNEVDNTLYYGAGNSAGQATSIIAVGGSGSFNQAIVISDTAPASPKAGNLWFDSANALLYMYYTDPNTSQWVNVNNLSGGLPDAPTDGKLYGRQSGGWSPTLAVSALTDIGRNKLHNALFNITQRGTGPWTAAGAYTLDRWQMVVSLDTFSASSQLHNDTTRAQIGDEEATNYFFAQVTGNAGAASYSIVQQKIEGVRRLAGKTVMVSFWAAGTVGSKIGVGLAQQFGTGGSPSADVGIAGQAVTITASWTRYLLTFAIPSISGKTLGTSGGDNTALTFWFSAGTTYGSSSGGVGVQTVNNGIWGVQLEIGSQATPLEKLDPRNDVANCQRFYQTGGFSFYAYNLAGQTVAQTWSQCVTMRAIPTMTTNVQGNTNLTSPSVNATSNGFTLQATVTATGAFGTFGTYTASSDY